MNEESSEENVFIEVFNSKLFFLFSVSLAVYFIFVAVPVAPKIAMSSTFEQEGKSKVDPCENKDRCVLVYLTPWCPTCEQAKPLVKEVRKKLNSAADVGLQVVIGQDKKEKLAELAKTLEGNIFFDYEGDFYEQMYSSGVPSWWVIDRERNVLENYVGTPEGAELPILAEHLIKEELKLSSYLSKSESEPNTQS